MPKVPRLPTGMKQAYFGQKVMRWGRRDSDAEARIPKLRLHELQEEGITAEIAEQWHLFYLAVLDETPDNPSAKGRAKLMKHARELLEESQS